MAKNNDFLTLAYYYYTALPNAGEFAEKHLAYCKSIGLRGRIIVADEGINGTVSAPQAIAEKYMDYLRSLPYFPGISFKVHQTEQHVFKTVHVRYKAEIVNSGLTAADDIKPYKETGKHLEPKDFREMMDRDDVVVLDVRSNYEHTLGRFRKAVTLDMENFREFPDKLQELEQYKDKTVVTYCTGGIKCEKASALLLKKGFRDVYQLKGGILNYGKEAGGENFDGKCYVFDERISVDVNQVNPTLVSTCAHCGEKTSRMVNCANPLCNDQFVMCEKCGWEWEGACSDACRDHEKKRPYTGSGYYNKASQDSYTAKALKS
ncbi:MAG: rhodanese-related sulfurtransferase [Bacteroidia bacterium]